ncbi:uncharacterized protein BBIP1 isoform X2 [Eurosta solidaginis]|uniref:uncharacterized protein BBIP1 isoform X2 n=1 Tax=Eurosta solidaginis TaxID=178769 RepID=UPI0035313BAD
MNISKWKNNHHSGCREYRLQLTMLPEEIAVGKIELIEPTTGKLFFEHKTELIFCKPHLISLKSQSLTRLEEMQRQSAKQLQTKRVKSTIESKGLPKAV